MRYMTTIESPVGPLALMSDGTSLTAVLFDDERETRRRKEAIVTDEAATPFPQARRELAEYFAGKRTTFEVPLAPEGTAFQRKVWSALLRVPYGATATYGDIARQIGAPKAVRAVGAANGRNPIAIVVPCHRVIGANGTLTGYGGGLDRKRVLLDLETAHATTSQQSGKLF